MGDFANDFHISGIFHRRRLKYDPMDPKIYIKYSIYPLFFNPISTGPVEKPSLLVYFSKLG